MLGEIKGNFLKLLDIMVRPADHTGRTMGAAEAWRFYYTAAIAALLLSCAAALGADWLVGIGQAAYTPGASLTGAALKILNPGYLLSFGGYLLLTMGTAYFAVAPLSIFIIVSLAHMFFTKIGVFRKGYESTLSAYIYGSAAFLGTIGSAWWFAFIQISYVGGSLVIYYKFQQLTALIMMMVILWSFVLDTVALAKQQELTYPISIVANLPLFAFMIVLIVNIWLPQVLSLLSG